MTRLSTYVCHHCKENGRHAKLFPLKKTAAFMGNSPRFALTKTANFRHLWPTLSWSSPVMVRFIRYPMYKGTLQRG